MSTVVMSVLSVEGCGIATEVIIQPKIELMAIIFASVSYFFSSEITDQICPYPSKMSTGEDVLNEVFRKLVSLKLNVHRSVT